MKELKIKLLKLIREGSASLEEIVQLLRVRDEEIDTLKTALKQLEIEGQIYSHSNGKYIIFPSQVKFNVAKVHIVDGEVELEDFPDVVLGKDDKALVRDKDIVVFRLTSKGYNNSQLAVLDKVLSREPIMETFLVQKKGEDLVVFNPAYGYGKLPANVTANVDDLVIFNIVYDEHFNVTDHVFMENLGNQFEETTKIKELLVKEGCRLSFPSNVMEEAKKQRDIPGVGERHNFANKRVLSLTDGNTQVVDNAMHIEANEDGTSKLFVHIADVTEYLDFSNPLYKNALERVTGYKGDGYDIPLFPPMFGVNTASLISNVPRMAITVEMAMDTKGQVTDYRIYRSLVISRINMNFKDADKALKDHYEPQYIKCLGMLEDLATLSDKRDAIKRERSELEIEKNRIVPVLDENNEITRFVPKTKTRTERIKENCLECANECLTKFFEKVRVPVIFKVQDNPSGEELKKMADILCATGIRVQRNFNGIEPVVLRNLLMRLKSSENGGIITELLLNAITGEVYDPVPGEHFGKGLPCYAEFTSPLSKVTDLINQFQIKYIMDKQSYVSVDTLQEMAEKANDKEITIKEIDDELEKMYMCRYMQGFLGQVFEGVISKVDDNGMEVILSNGIKGYVTFQNMEDDFYKFNPSFNLISSKRGKMSYRVNTKIYVRIEKVDAQSRRIDFAIGPSITRGDMIVAYGENGQSLK